MTGSGLRVSDDLVLPLEAVTETFCIVAQRGSGKTFTASVLVEEFVAAGLPVCILDPVGVWWGLRSSADGAGAGLPVTILGGDHGDLPLPETAGDAVADLVVDERLPVVLDLSLMRKGRQRHFVTEFLERLFQRNRDPLHLVVDEADLFAPQRGGADTARMLGAYEDIVRRGRARGLGSTNITQRPASLHKDILTQASVLVAMRLTGKHDVTAVDDWVRLNAEPGRAAEVERSLASLPVGTAWVWSPGWLEILVKVTIRQRWTFDSSATPKPGQRAASPTQFATVDGSDLDRLRARITAADDEGDAGDRAARLQQRVRQLETQLAAAAERPAPVEVPVLTAQDRATAKEALTKLTQLTEQLARVVEQQPSAVPPTRRHKPPPDRSPSPASTSAKPTAAVGAAKLKAGERRMLHCLAQRAPHSLNRTQWGLLVGLRPTGTTFSRYLTTLRSNGLVEHSGEKRFTVTEAGQAAAGADAAVIDASAVREQWLQKLKLGERNMLQALIDCYPRWMNRDDLAAVVDINPAGTTFSRYLTTLRSNELVEVDGRELRAAEALSIGSGYR